MNQTLFQYYSFLNTEVRNLLNTVARASIEIERYVRYQAIHDVKPVASLENASGDVQKHLDVLSHDIMVKHLTQSKSCNVLLSEEVDEPILVPKEHKGLYLVAFDPLDGSSNIDCNAPVGTIFSIYENKKEEVLLKGDQIVAAGYVLYGPATELIIAVNGKVDRFVLNSHTNYVFIETITLKGKSKKIYSINEANSNQWKKDIDQYIAQYKQANYTARYIGSMVGDVHRTLMYGGMFCYPADRKNPNGKLRLFYECYPIAYIMELAGGKAIVGNESNQRILEVEPTKVHQRTPILLGTVEEIIKYETILLSKL
uniref:fructose-bisphosphatase n=1 Tax=viral metagenome TaxID=1070528 RepID=A0A6C0KT86_9ZZZZ